MARNSAPALACRSRLYSTIDGQTVTVVLEGAVAHPVSSIVASARATGIRIVHSPLGFGAFGGVAEVGLHFALARGICA